MNNLKLTVKKNFEINQWIKYIVKNDATLTLQEEIDLLFDGSGFYDDSYTSQLANTKVSFEKNGNVLIGNNPLLYSMIFNALVRDITEEDILNCYEYGIETPEIKNLENYFELYWGAHKEIVLCALNDETKYKLVTNPDSSLKISMYGLSILITSFKDDQYKLDCLNNSLVLDKLDHETVFSIIKSMKSDRAKESCLNNENLTHVFGDYYKAEIIGSLSNDNLKMKYLNSNIISGWHNDNIAIIIENLDSDEVKLKYLKNPDFILGLTTSGISSLIKSFKSDELKNEFLILYKSKLNDTDLAKIVSSFNSDEYKIHYLFDDEFLYKLINYPESLFKIIFSIKKDDNKIKVLSDKIIGKYLDNSYYKLLINSLETDEAKMECLLNINISTRLYSDDVVDILLSMVNEEMIVDYLLTIKLNDTYLKTIIISLESDKLKKRCLFNHEILQCLDDKYITDIILSMASDEDKLDCLNDDNIFRKINPSFKSDIIETLKSDELKLGFILKNYLELGVYPLTLAIVSIKSDEFKIKCLQNDSIFAKLSSYNYTLIIESFESDELKVKYITSTQNIDIGRILYSIKSDILKRDLLLDDNILSKLDETNTLVNVIYSIKSNKMKKDIILEEKIRNRLTKYDFTYIVRGINKEELDGELYVIMRIINSNSIEISNLGLEMIYPLFVKGLSQDEISKKIDDLEKIFLRNNIPYFAKVFLCFREIYPDLSKKDGKEEKFDFNDNSRMAPQLQNEAILRLMFRNETDYNNAKSIIMGDNTSEKNKLIELMNEFRFGIIFNDLLRIAIYSNNRALNEYLEDLENGNKIYERIQSENDYNELSSGDKNVLVNFLNHLKVLSEYKGVSEVNNDSVLDEIEKCKKIFQPTSRYSLLDRIVRSFCFYGGYRSFEELKSRINTIVNEANQKGIDNAKLIEDKPLKIESGDFIRCIGNVQALGSINDGNLCKELLGSVTGKSESDTTPLDSDWTRFRDSDIDSTIEKSIEGTPTGFGFGTIFFIIKGNKENPNYIISRTESGKEEVKYDPNKIEMFNTGFASHYGARIGTAIADIDYILINSNSNNNYSYTLNATKNELVKTGIYVPIVNMDGKLVFSKREFDLMTNKLAGLKKYNHEIFDISNYDLDIESFDVPWQEDVISIPSIGDIEREIKIFDNERTQDESIVRNNIENYIKEKTECKMISDHITGDLTQGKYELLCTGSTARGTCIPGDADYDYILRIDNDMLDKIPDLIDGLRNKLNPKSTIPGRSNRFRGKGIKFPGFDKEYEIDITFIAKTNKMEYYTEAALSDRLEELKKQHPEEYDKVRANIVMAKMVLKVLKVYKPAKSDISQGGLGGVGIENWILQNNGSFRQAIDDFLLYAIKDGKMVDFDDFKREYHIWDAGANHETEKDAYSFDDFINNNLTNEGYKKMCTALLIIKKELMKQNELDIEEYNGESR